MAGMGNGGLGFQALLAGGALLLAAGLVVRAIPPPREMLPRDVPQDGPRIVEPMQMLARGARLRAEELDVWIAPERQSAFRAAREAVFGLQGCPNLLDWIDSAEGQRVERLISDLRAGTREEAFASLVLTFQLARGARWRPGVLGRTQHAERLGALLQDWLRVCGPRAARDGLLAEPALAATLLYGRVMRAAWRAPTIGYNQAPYDRAVTFLADLTGIPSGRRTDLGAALQTRYARAATRMLAREDALIGLDEEAAVLLPDLTGKCGE